jgi:hypothetical protein
VGSPELPGRPLRARRGRTPRRMRCDLALLRSQHCCLQVVCYPGHPKIVISWLHPHGSHARAPTLRPCRCRHRRKARYRPAGLGSGRTGFAPAGRLIPISDSHRLLSFQGTGIARSHQTPSFIIFPPSRPSRRTIGVRPPHFSFSHRLARHDLRHRRGLLQLRRPHRARNQQRAPEPVRGGLPGWAAVSSCA